MQEAEFRKYVEWLCRIWNDQELLELLDKDREYTNAEENKTLF